MIKDESSYYESTGKRTARWVKLKTKGLVGSSMRDTLDLVPIAAFFGKGNRTGTLGSFIMAAYNP